MDITGRKNTLYSRIPLKGIVHTAKLLLKINQPSELKPMSLLQTGNNIFIYGLGTLIMNVERIMSATDI